MNRMFFKGESFNRLGSALTSSAGGHGSDPRVWTESLYIIQAPTLYSGLRHEDSLEYIKYGFTKYHAYIGMQHLVRNY